MIAKARVWLHAWLNPAKDQDRRTRARKITIATAITAAVILLALLALYAGVLVGLFVDGYRIAT